MHVLAVPVGDEALQAADRDRLALDAADALALALGFLRADAAGQRGQRVGRGHDLISSGEVALCDLGNKFRDADIDRAAFDTQRLLAVQAALCFLDGHLGSIAKGNFLEVLISNVRLLFGHGSLCHRHIRHGILPLT